MDPNVYVICFRGHTALLMLHFTQSAESAEMIVMAFFGTREALHPFCSFPLILMF